MPIEKQTTKTRRTPSGTKKNRVAPCRSFLRASLRPQKWSGRALTVRAGVLLLLLLLLAGTARAAAPEPFDPDRALDHARYLSETIGDRPAGSTGEQAAAGWIAARFEELGYTVRVQPFNFYSEGQLRIGMNVIATRTGQAGYGTIYAGAHYDTVKRIAGIDYGGPGANDNASGVGVLLEAARVLATETVTPTLTFVAFGAEELGLTGSRYYVSTLPPWEWVQAESMVNFDCVGIGDQLILYVDREQDKAFAAA
ncbi:MAG: M20/M25/M40 family metallo-hydrolase, partial [Caldilinea sp.]|nr:M20/M25/M40 family metallo-hydrolase [Caldilinea sp.]